eukprot:1161416-Pelagomonas_calceolata.AAC.5
MVTFILPVRANFFVRASLGQGVGLELAGQGLPDSRFVGPMVGANLAGVDICACSSSWSVLWGSAFQVRMSSKLSFSVRIPRSALFGVSMLCLPKRFLGVKCTTPNWSVLRECGHAPIEFYWFRAAVRFYNALLRSNSTTLSK